jgi:hypothetical protein
MRRVDAKLGSDLRRAPAVGAAPGGGFPPPGSRVSSAFWRSTGENPPLASFSCSAGFSRLETCCSKLELPARKTVVNYNGFPRRDAHLPVETFNKSVRKLSKARAILVGVGNGNEDYV